MGPFVDSITLDEERFQWRHEPRPEAPWRVVPYQNGRRSAVSYRRCLTLATWGEGQFGYRPFFECQSAEFRSESDMILFVTFWSGTEIERSEVPPL